MRKVLKSLLSLLFVCLLSAQLFAADGTVTYIKGKVEVKRGESWVSLRVGDTVAQSEIINTGFQSEAKVKLMDSVLYLGPVTRVSLDQLSSSSDKDKVNVYLSTGTIRSKVNRTNDKSVSYTVRTPIAVASVRGTDFSIASDGTLRTIQGKVAYSTVQNVEDDDDNATEEEEEEEEEEEKDKVELSEDEGDDKKSDSDDSDGTASSDAEDTGKVSESKSGDKSDKKEPAKKADGDDKKDIVVADDSNVSAPVKETPRSTIKKSSAELAMEESEGLPNEMLVRANQSIDFKSARNFGTAASNTASTAMNVVSSISSEGAKSSVGQSNTSVVTSVSNSIASGGTVGAGPSSGTIKVHVAEPVVGNISVEVVLPAAKK